MRGGMIFGGHFTVISKTTGKFLFSAHAGFVLMLFKRQIKTINIHRQAVFKGQLLGHLEWEAVGVVQFKSVFTRNFFDELAGFLSARGGYALGVKSLSKSCYEFFKFFEPL